MLFQKIRQRDLHHCLQSREQADGKEAISILVTRHFAEQLAQAAAHECREQQRARLIIDARKRDKSYPASHFPQP